MAAPAAQLRRMGSPRREAVQAAPLSLMEGSKGAACFGAFATCGGSMAAEGPAVKTSIKAQKHLQSHHNGGTYPKFDESLSVSKLASGPQWCKASNMKAGTQPIRASLVV